MNELKYGRTQLYQKLTKIVTSSCTRINTVYCLSLDFKRWPENIYFPSKTRFRCFLCGISGRNIAEVNVARKYRIDFWYKYVLMICVPLSSYFR